MNLLPLEPGVLPGLVVAVGAVAVGLARVARAVSAPAWPLTEGLTTPDSRGRDLRLAHLVRLLRTHHLEEAHQVLTEVAALRLASTSDVRLTDPRAADLLGADVVQFLTSPPHNSAEYLKALDRVLARLERT